MVLYNPKDWLKLIFQFHKSDTFRVLLPALIGMGIYTAILAYVENTFIKTIHEDPTKIHNLLGFVLSMLLVFRINSAYDRWYEGRKMWGGLVNSTRNLALKINALTHLSNEAKNEWKMLITDYVFSVKEHLRGNFKKEELSGVNTVYAEQEINNADHRPNFIAAQMYKKLANEKEKAQLDTASVLMMNEDLRALTELCGGCERIKNTPIPYSYSLFLKKIIFIYVFTLPIGYVITFKYWAIPIAILVFYAFASLEVISEEIEDPFGNDANDLPTDEICQTIKKNVSEVLK